MALRNFGDSLPSLRSVTYREMVHVGDKSLWYLFKANGSVLVKVDLRGCRRMKGRCLRLFGPALEQIILDGCCRVDNMAIEDLCLRAPNVRELRLSGCSLITDETLRFKRWYDSMARPMSQQCATWAWVKSNPARHQAGAFDIRVVFDAAGHGMIGFEILVQRSWINLALAAFPVTEIGADPQTAAGTSTCRFLKTTSPPDIILSSKQDLNDFLVAVFALEQHFASGHFFKDTAVQIKILDYNSAVSNEVLEAIIKEAPELRSLSIAYAGTDTTLTETSLKCIANLKQLCTVSLDKVLKAVFMEAEEAGHKVDMSSLAAVTNAVLTQIASECTQLQDIRVRNCTYLGDDGVCSLAQLSRLEHVDLSGCLLVTTKAKKDALPTVTVVVGGTICDVGSLRTRGSRMVVDPNVSEGDVRFGAFEKNPAKNNRVRLNEVNEFRLTKREAFSRSFIIDALRVEEDDSPMDNDQSIQEWAEREARELGLISQNLVYPFRLEWILVIMNRELKPQLMSPWNALSGPSACCINDLMNKHIREEKWSLMWSLYYIRTKEEIIGFIYMVRLQLFMVSGKFYLLLEAEERMCFMQLVIETLRLGPTWHNLMTDLTDELQVAFYCGEVGSSFCVNKSIVAIRETNRHTLESVDFERGEQYKINKLLACFVLGFEFRSQYMFKSIEGTYT
uniref:Uncharacterized protein n=1 Tax=Parascaris equorum TaxID=6256 RepID=A0A914RLY8_PAREQ